MEIFLIKLASVFVIRYLSCGKVLELSMKFPSFRNLLSLARLARSAERIADALERAYPPRITNHKPRMLTESDLSVIDPQTLDELDFMEEQRRMTGGQRSES